MATVTKTTLDVTFVLAFDDEDNLDVELNAEDNNNPSCYLPDIDYYVRLYRSRNDMTIIARANFGSIALDNPSIFEDISEEIVFSNSSDGTTGKLVKSDFLYTPVGIVYDSSLDPASGVALLHTDGSTSIRASETIFGIYDVSYRTEYMRYMFRVSRTGSLMLSFLGS